MITNTLMFEPRVLNRRAQDPTKHAGVLITGGEHIDVQVEVIDIGPFKGLRWTMPAQERREVTEPPIQGTEPPRPATTQPSGITRNRYYKGSHIPVPKDIREAMCAMPYPALVEFAHRVQSKAHHLTNLGPNMTIALHDAIRRELGSEKQSALPLLPDLPE